MIEEKGEWSEKRPCGPMFLEVTEGDDEKKGVKYNPYWCQNPQYFINITQPTHVKVKSDNQIILRKDKEVTRRADKIKIGLSVCKHMEEKEEVIDVKRTTTVKAGVKIDQLTKLLKQTSEQLEPPKMETIERKLQVGKYEDYYESSFMNTDLAALYFHFLPIHGPLVIMPCQGEKSKNNNFTLRIYSDKKVKLQKLDEAKNVCLIGNWGTSTSGGCDLYNEIYYKNPDLQSWTKNPKFQLAFESTAPAKVKITLAIADKNWRGKVAEVLKKKKEKEMKEQREQMADRGDGILRHPKKAEDVRVPNAVRQRELVCGHHDNHIHLEEEGQYRAGRHHQEGELRPEHANRAGSRR